MTTAAATAAATSTLATAHSAGLLARVWSVVPGVELLPALAAGAAMVVSLARIF